jgi:hypothetical protein
MAAENAKVHEEPRLEPVKGGWMARSGGLPRVAVIRATKEEALQALGEELDAWAQLQED